MRRLPMILAAVPLIVILIGIARAEHHLATSETWLVDVEGYDPRDLLHGRYLQFQLRVPGPGLKECGYEDDCSACLTVGVPWDDGTPTGLLPSRQVLNFARF